MWNSHHWQLNVSPLLCRKGSNVLSIWGNQNSMNINPLILTNIQSSPYSKVRECRMIPRQMTESNSTLFHRSAWQP